MTGKAVWFALEDTTGTGGQNGTVVHLDRSRGDTVNGWSQFPGGVNFPSAGCYVFFAQWKKGGWLLPVSVGR